MEHHHSATGWSCKTVDEYWKRPIEWIVTLPPARGERIAELHRQVRDGVYDSRATIDVVARRILQSGDL
jgi:hypothetical protein